MLRALYIVLSKKKIQIFAEFSFTKCLLGSIIIKLCGLPLLTKRMEVNTWACSSAGSAKGSVFCHIYNFILLYSSVPLLELLIWARSSVWESVRFASVRSRVRSPSGPPHSGDLKTRSPEFFHAFRMRDSTHSCPLPDAGSRRTVSH